jgi:hypothetical protein
MAHEIQEIKLCQNESQKLQLLRTAYRNGRVTLGNIYQCDVTSEILNFLGVAIELECGVQQALPIYHKAMLQNSLWAKCNMARCLSCSSSLVERNQSLLLYVDLYMNRNNLQNDMPKYFICYWAGVHYFNQDQYADAWRAFSNMFEYVVRNGRQELFLYFNQGMSYLRRIKDYTIAILEGLQYKQAQHVVVRSMSHEDEATESLEIVIEQPAQSTNEIIISPWIALSPSIDLYDFSQRKDICIAYELAEKERLAADAACPLRSKSFLLDPTLTVEEEYAIKATEARDKVRVEYDHILIEGKIKGVQRLIQCEDHFFSMTRNRNPKVLAIAIHLLKQRQRDTKDAESKDMTNVPVRHLITAELAVIDASVVVMGPRSDFGYNVTAFPWTFSHVEKKKYDVICGFSEYISYGQSIIEYYHRLDPHVNHLGDFFMKHLGRYEHICHNLSSLTYTDSQFDQEKEKKLARCMLRYTQSGIPITLAELRHFNDEADEVMLQDIIRIFYHCFVKEPASWMRAQDKSRRLPLAISQLRAVKLIAKGYLHLRDVFGQNSDYGVFTGDNIGDPNGQRILKEKIKRINQRYTSEILLKRPENFEVFSLFQQEYPQAIPVVTRARVHKELKKWFGGDSDTDGEGYDSETGETLYPCLYRP